MSRKTITTMIFKFNNGWVIEAQDVTETENRIRGFVLDGQYHMDYDKINHVFNAVARQFFMSGSIARAIDWSKPVASHKDVVLL